VQKLLALAIFAEIVGALAPQTWTGRKAELRRSWAEPNRRRKRQADIHLPGLT
jgi:hypothetical protein